MKKQRSEKCCVFWVVKFRNFSDNYNAGGRYPRGAGVGGKEP